MDTLVLPWKETLLRYSLATAVATAGCIGGCALLGWQDLIPSILCTWLFFVVMNAASLWIHWLFQQCDAERLTGFYLYDKTVRLFLSGLFFAMLAARSNEVPIVLALLFMGYYLAALRSESLYFVQYESTLKKVA